MSEASETAAQEETETLGEFTTRLNQCKQHSQHWRKEAKDLYDIKAGHQWSPEDEAALKDKFQNTYPMVTFNLADKYNDAVTGMQINNRQEIRYFPRRPGTIGIDEYATGVVKWNRDQCEAEDEESDMFSDVFWIGMGWIEHYLDDSEEAEGWIAQERRDPLEMYWDWMSRKKNLTDKRFLIRIKPMTAEEYTDFFGEETGDNLNIEGASTQFDFEDSMPLVIPIPHDYGTTEGGSSNSPKPIYVADYQWYEVETEYSVTAMFPGDQQPVTQKFDEKEWKKIKSALDKTGTQYKVTDHPNKIYYRCWIAGDSIKLPVGAKDKIMQLPGGFTYEAITGKRDRNTNTWYGMGRSIRDPQMWVNKFFSSILYTLSVNSKGGLIVEESAIDNRTKFEQDYADPSAISVVNDGAITNQRIMPKPGAPYPDGMDKLMNFALNAMPMTSGLNPEVLGLTQRDQANSLEENRKKSAMAIVAWVFDSMRRYYKRSGKLMLSMIKAYLGEGQLVKIVGQQGAQYVPLLKSNLSQQYDIIVDESPTSTNMQERVWGIILQMLPIAQEMQLPVPVEIIDYSPLPEDLKQKWKQKLAPDPQKQQMQQTMQQLAQQGAQAKVAVDQTKAQLNSAQAQLATVEAQTGEQAAPTKIALDQVEAVRKAAEAGHLQAGGS